jgi:acetyltransferase-like isoleucine patch superfamily enzyme
MADGVDHAVVAPSLWRRLARRIAPPDHPAGHRTRVEEGVRRRLSNAESFVDLQEQAKAHIADGTLVLGNQTYAAPRVWKFKGDTHRVVIGNWSSIAPDADFYVGGMHPIHWVSMYGIREMNDLPGAYDGEMPMSKGDITVGSDCWVTNKTTVLSGVTIGDGAVVATQAVVTKDVPAYQIVAGNPAKVIGQRFEDHQIEALLRIRWWDWPTERVLEEVDWLNGKPIDAFIQRFGG